MLWPQHYVSDQEFKSQNMENEGSKLVKGKKKELCVIVNDPFGSPCFLLHISSSLLVGSQMHFPAISSQLSPSQQGGSHEESTCKLI